MKRILTVGVILLFVGVAVAPSINQSVVKATDDHLVEVTTQACGIQGYGNTTVKLTREQYQNLELYLVEFRARLNQTSTREEAAPIFKEAVVELDKYGLLPKGMSVNQTYRLIMKPIEQRLQLFDANYFCLVSGNTLNTGVYGPFAIFAEHVIHNILSRLVNPSKTSYFPGSLFENFIEWLLNLLYILTNAVVTGVAALFFIMCFTGGFFGIISPVGLLSLLTFGTIWSLGGDGDKEPSSGWVYSIGLTGIKKYEGPELWGTARKKPYYSIPIGFSYPGVLGFSGLKLGDPFENTFFLGSALKVNLSTDFPGIYWMAK
ncbi:MAG: hypothetical protein MUC80_08810 [Candidatus Thermoplasmatota archaeon]|nr:hypothetical protein [Candidatus Thermoplasmatota archaeon]